MLAQAIIQLRMLLNQSESDLNSSQDICHLDTTIEKKIFEPLISLSSELLIENESDIDTLILLLKQKFQMSQEKLEQWRAKIVFELRDNTLIEYW
ncbi:hypothetical protein Glove_212g22 [Diversispora epigaea]|uniref:Uncharacterized protein n=1 Tax=Diversispora epigaea TaxID=1348612 RepID=A0A397II02_9GLOM|nr:hypothetical protein Glove_212g22 [Diversispora epigaea]